MVPVEVLPLEEDVGDDNEDDERDDLLNDLQLHQGERAAVSDEAYPVGRYLTAVFKEGDCPREEYDAQQRPVCGDAGLVELQVSVPRQRHKNVAANEQ